MKGNGIGSGTLLFLLFLALKLTGYIDWSWWWVTAPLWAGAALVVGLAALALLLGVLITFVKGEA